MTSSSNSFTSAFADFILLFFLSESKQGSVWQRSTCKPSLRISLYCCDPYFHENCDCYSWSNPLQVSWAPDNTSPALIASSELNTTQHNATQHNTTQLNTIKPLPNHDQREEHVHDKALAPETALQHQEIPTINPLLLHRPNFDPTSSRLSSTLSTVQPQVLSDGNAIVLPR